MTSLKVGKSLSRTFFSGTLFRVDSAVVLPLKKVRESDLPTLTEIINEIEKLL
jgi:formylmethanofuran dehydrogenase subunit B